MATFNSTNYGKQVGSAGASPSASYPLAKFIAGKVRYSIIPYVLAGTEAANDIINIVRLKVGAVVIPSLSILALPVTWMRCVTVRHLQRHMMCRSLVRRLSLQLRSNIRLLLWQVGMRLFSLR